MGVAAFVLTRPDRTVPEARAIGAYRVVYRIEDFTDADVRVTTETLEVRRPYDSRVEQRLGPPPGDDVTQGQVTNMTYLWSLRRGADVQFGVVRPPGGPLRDASLSVLADAADAGFVEVAGRSRVLGRPCTRFAGGAPRTEPLITPGTDRFEFCISREGIVLREEWTFGGRRARVAEAVEVSEQRSPDARFFVGRTPPDDEAAALVGTQGLVRDAGEPDGLLIGVDPPTGWRRERSAFVAQSGGQGGTPSQVFAAAYRRGSEVVVVERSTSEQVAPVWDPSEGERAQVDAGPARVVYYLDHVEVRLVGQLGYARVVGPSKAVALAFAAALRPAG